MKKFIAFIATALVATGCMLESPDPCDTSPISCDVHVDTRPAKPSTPSLSATSGTEAITINFSAPRAEYYFVHYSETLPVGTQNQFESTSTSHTFTGLDPNKEYHFSITGVNERGISPASATVTTQPKTVATSPTVSPTTDTSNTVTWTAVNGADDYIVYMSQATPVTTSDTAANAGTGTSFVHTGLTAGDTWYYMVTPRNEVGAVASTEVSTEVLPQAPGTLVAQPKAAGGGIETQWTASAGHDGYKLIYKYGSHSLSDILASPSNTLTVNAGSTSKNITTVSINQLASIVLVAYNSAGNSTYSNVVEEQPVPRSPQLTTPDVSRPGKVTLTWGRADGVNTFKVYRMTGSSGNPETAGGAPIATLSGSTLTYTDSGFPAYGGTTYRYAVVPEGGGGVGAIDRANAVPVEPAWETIVNPVSLKNFLQVAGTSTGEAYVLGTEYRYADSTVHTVLWKYNNVAELDYSVSLTSGTWADTPGHDRALALEFAPDGNLLTLMRHSVASMPSNLTTIGTEFVYVLSKIDQSNGSVIWNVAINPYTDAQWQTVNPNSDYLNSKWVGLLADMVVDSTGAAYVAWGTTGASGWHKYDTTGSSLTLVGSYDRVADTTGESLGKYHSKPAIVLLPDDSFFWFQHVEKNSTDYLMGSKWASDGSVIFKNRTLDVSRLAYYVHPLWKDRGVTSNITGGTNAWGFSNSRQTGNAVADAAGNIFVAFTNLSDRILKFNSEGTYIDGTNDGIAEHHELVLATNGQDIYVADASGAANVNPTINRYDNTLTTKQFDMEAGGNVGWDVYVDPTSCFVYFAGTHPSRDWTVNVGTSTRTAPAGKFSYKDITAYNGSFMLFRTDSDYKLNAASSTCPTPATSTKPTPVSIAGTGDELSTYVHSGKNGWGDWRVKHSSASSEIEHTIPHVIDMSYGGDSQCVATPTGVQCKGYQGGGLGDATETPSSATYVTVDVLTSAMDVSVGSDFACALSDNGTPYCWGNGQKGRIGDGGTTTRTKPVEVSTSTLFASIESGKAHTCALTSDGVVWCWGDNSDAQMAEDPASKNSFKKPQAIAEFGSTKFSKVSIGTDSLFTAALMDNGSIAVWGEYAGATYDNHFILNSGDADDVAAGTDHICYIENAAVTCVGNNDDGQTTVPTMTKTPYTVATGSSSTGKDWSCAGFTDGTYQCWGSKASW